VLAGVEADAPGSPSLMVITPRLISSSRSETTKPPDSAAKSEM